MCAYFLLLEKCVCAILYKNATGFVYLSTTMTFITFKCCLNSNTSLRHSLCALVLKGQRWQISQLVPTQNFSQTELNSTYRLFQSSENASPNRKLLLRRLHFQLQQILIDLHLLTLSSLLHFMLVSLYSLTCNNTNALNNNIHAFLKRVEEGRQQMINTGFNQDVRGVDMHINVLFDQLFNKHKRLIIHNFFFMLTLRKRMNRYVPFAHQFRSSNN